MANLSEYIIGDTWKNVYHLLLPYTIGDSRMEYIPVYIKGEKTSLSLSKTTIKIGSYIYPNTATPYSVFYLNNKNSIIQYNQFQLTPVSFSIGSNVFITSALSTNNGGFLVVGSNDNIVSTPGYTIGNIIVESVDGLSSTITIDNTPSTPYIINFAGCTYNNNKIINNGVNKLSNIYLTITPLSSSAWSNCEISTINSTDVVSKQVIFAGTSLEQVYNMIINVDDVSMSITGKNCKITIPNMYISEGGITI